MIVWGGLHDETYAHDVLNTGGRYNPATNTWSATGTTNALVARYGHTALWTGGNMLVWAGASDTPGAGNTGAKYHPATNVWTAISTTNAPPSRWRHTAVWTGTEMIIWGGEGDNGWSHGLSTGGRYNPTTNTWTTTNGNAPTGRWFHTAVWTGAEMIIWGGEDDNHVDLAGDTNTGGRYYPSTDQWTHTSITNAPSARANHTAIWTGIEMIIWGGFDYFGPLNTGGRYNSVTNSWRATSTVNAPTGRSSPAVWTGTEMIVWGGGGDGVVFNTGGRYNPSTNTWASTSITNAPSARANHTAVWTGNQLIVWGGTNIYQNEYLNTGGRYNPTTNRWTATSITNAPSGRYDHTAVWTGNDMIIWGGYFFDGREHLLNTGGRYNPGTNGWTATSTTNAPTGRDTHRAVWTGDEMIVWGGDPGFVVYGTGGRYNPGMNSWTAITTANAAIGRYQPTLVWTGSEMIVWGGFCNLFGPLDSGGIYCGNLLLPVPRLRHSQGDSSRF